MKSKVYRQIVGSGAAAFLFFFAAMTAIAQPDVRGLSFEPGFVRFTATANNPCYFLPPPYASTCGLVSPGNLGTTLNYWRRTYGCDLPVYAEAGLGLRYFYNTFEVKSNIYEAGVPDTLLSQSVASYRNRALYLHLPIGFGYQFNIKGLPVDVRGGVYTDLQVYGISYFSLAHTYFYATEIVEDSAYHYLKIKKQVLDNPEHFTEFNYKNKEWGRDFANILGFSVAIHATLPVKSRHAFKLGYHYERPINPIQYLRYRIEDSHSLSLSIGFNEKSKAWNSPRHQPTCNKPHSFVFGTDLLFQTYRDGFTSDLGGMALVFAYNNPSGFMPELRLGGVTSWKGYENASETFLAVAVGYSKLAKGYVVPKFGLQTARYHNFNLDDSSDTISSLFGGAALRFPNTGYLRMELSALGHIWTKNAGFQPLQIGCGMYYFFRQGTH